MCIAISKPMGVSLPSEKILKNCWNNNDDGAGFAFNLNNKVIIKKGFMTFNDFITNLRDCDKKFNLKSRGVLMHFRIATHGARDASMTHPFPIVDDAGCLKKIEYVSDYAVIHNGIISLTSSEVDKKSGLSDTALFIKDYLTKISTNRGWLNKQANIELIEKLINSKMSILDKFGNIKMTSGFTEDSGVYYSNTSYKDNYLGGYYGYMSNCKNYYGEYYGYNDVDYLNNIDSDLTKDGWDSPTDDDYILDLMKIDTGDTLELDDGYSYVIDNGMDYFIDKYGNIYISDIDDGSDPEYDINREYIYIGTGVVYNKLNLISQSFKGNTTAYYYQLH